MTEGQTPPPDVDQVTIDGKGPTADVVIDGEGPVEDTDEDSVIDAGELP